MTVTVDFIWYTSHFPQVHLLLTNLLIAHKYHWSFHIMVVIRIVVNYLVPQVIIHPLHSSIVLITNVQRVLESGFYILLGVQQSIYILRHSLTGLGIHLLIR